MDFPSHRIPLAFFHSLAFVKIFNIFYPNSYDTKKAVLTLLQKKIRTCFYKRYFSAQRKNKPAGMYTMRNSVACLWRASVKFFQSLIQQTSRRHQSLFILPRFIKRHLANFHNIIFLTFSSLTSIKPVYRFEIN